MMLAVADIEASITAIGVGIGTLLVGGSAFLTWIITRSNSKSTQASGLMDDALELQKAASSAYRDAKEELDQLRSEIQSIREDVAVMQQEMEHWRSIAAQARAQYQREQGRDPSWWSPFRPGVA